MYTAKCAIALYKVVISTSYLGNSVGTHPQLVGHRIVAMGPGNPGNGALFQ